MVSSASKQSRSLSADISLYKAGRPGREGGEDGRPTLQMWRDSQRALSRLGIAAASRNKLPCSPLFLWLPSLLTPANGSRPRRLRRKHGPNPFSGNPPLELECLDAQPVIYILGSRSKRRKCLSAWFCDFSNAMQLAIGGLMQEEDTAKPCHTRSLTAQAYLQLAVRGHSMPFSQ